MNNWMQKVKTTYLKMLREEASLDGPNSGDEYSPEEIEELKRQRYYHPVHNPAPPSDPRDRGYYINTAHPDKNYQGWYREEGPYRD